MRAELSYRAPFILDESKLKRLQKVIEENYQEKFPDCGYQHSYRIFLKSAKSFTFSELGDVVALDNTLRDPIVSLCLQAWMIPEAAVCEAASSSNVIAKEKHRKMSVDPCSIYVKFSMSEWSLEVVLESAVDADSRRPLSILSAVEEQVERTVQRSWIAKLNVTDAWRRGLVVSFLLLMSIGFISVDRKLPNHENMWLSKADLRFFEQHPQQLTYEEVVRRQIKNLQARSSEGIASYLANWRLYAATGPLVLVIGVLTYLVFRCYPPIVFQWGDMGEWYQAILNRRKLLWTTVVLGVIIELLANLAVYGVVQK